MSQLHLAFYRALERITRRLLGGHSPSTAFRLYLLWALVFVAGFAFVVFAVSLQSR
jgi:hypothetical protein